MGSNLDKELEAILDDDDAGAVDDDGMAVPTDGAEEKREPRREADTPPKGSRGLLAVLLVMVVGIVALFMGGFEGGATYSMKVDQLLARKGELTGRRVRIDGELIEGTLKKRDKPCEYRFRIKNNGKDVEIRYPQCVVPDTFRDAPGGGVFVTAEGKLLDDGHFEATLIMAKCTSKYDPKTHKVAADGKGPADPNVVDTPAPIN